MMYMINRSLSKQVASLPGGFCFQQRDFHSEAWLFEMLARKSNHRCHVRYLLCVVWPEPIGQMRSGV